MVHLVFDIMTVLRQERRFHSRQRDQFSFNVG